VAIRFFIDFWKGGGGSSDN